MKRPWIKFCGLTRPDDVRAAVQIGADLIGVNFYSESPRAVSFGLARTLCEVARNARLPKGRRRVRTVAVFVNPDEELVQDVLKHVEPDILQFHGDESPTFCSSFKRPFIKAVQLESGASATTIPAYMTDYTVGYLIDTHSPNQYGGTGRLLSLDVARRALQHPRGFLAGGLKPTNVEGLVRALRPFGVDVASGIEELPGIKNTQEMLHFVQAVERACEA